MSPTYKVVLIVALLCALCIWLIIEHYQNDKNITVLATDLLQGYWRLQDDVYLLIDGNLIQIVNLGTANNKPDVYLKSVGSNIVLTSKQSLDLYQFDVTLADDRQINPIIDLPQNIVIEMSPVFGSITINAMGDGKELTKAVKDNEMSMVHFASS